MSFILVGAHYLRFEHITEVRDGTMLMGGGAREVHVCYVGGRKALLQGSMADSFMEQFLYLAEREKQRDGARKAESERQTAVANAFRKGGPATVAEVRAQLGAQIESLQVENVALLDKLERYEPALQRLLSNHAALSAAYVEATDALDVDAAREINDRLRLAWDSIQQRSWTPKPP